MSAIQDGRQNMAEYKVGDRDTRPWGHYVVTGVGANAAGEEYCEKEITVNSGKILSLQSHEHRRETWIVEQGTLTVVLNDRRIELSPGGELMIPKGSIHCMANLGDTPCIVRERQEGLCREEDIRRYVDAYGRQTYMSLLPGAGKSIALYRKILTDIEKLAA
jgi:mannose-6-phosphate isomerase